MFKVILIRAYHTMYSWLFTRFHDMQKPNLLYKHQWNTKWDFPRKLHTFTREDKMLSSHVKKTPSLWLHKSRLWKQADLVFHWCLYNKKIITYSFVFNSISHSFATLTRELSSWPLEDKIHIHARACNILYLTHSKKGVGALGKIFWKGFGVSILFLDFRLLQSRTQYYSILTFSNN